MNQQHSGLFNGAVAAAVVGLIAFALSKAGITLPDAEQNDIMVLLTWGAGYWLNGTPVQVQAMQADIATLKAQSAPAAGQPAASPVVSAALALIALGVAAASLSACALFPQSARWTPVQVGYFEMAIATAAENTAAEIVHSPELAPGYAAVIVAAGQSASASVQAQVTVLSNGGSTSAQIQAAGLSGLVPIINNLGAILAHPPGAVSTAQLKAQALQGGLDVLQQLPAVIGVVAELNSGWVPGPADMAAETKVLQDATAGLTAATAKAPAGCNCIFAPVAGTSAK